MQGEVTVGVTQLDDVGRRPSEELGAPRSPLPSNPLSGIPQHRALSSQILVPTASPTLPPILPSAGALRPLGGSCVSGAKPGATHNANQDDPEAECGGALGRLRSA